MLSALMGILLGWIKELIFLGMAFIETIVATVAFNYLAPNLPQYGYTLPFDHVKFWHVFAFIVCVHVIGGLVQRLTPSIVKIDNSSESKNEKK